MTTMPLGIISPLILAAKSTDLLIAAERYLTLGFSIIPLRGKVPTVEWGTYQQRRPTQFEIERWRDCGLLHNIGIVCGQISGNLIVFDFDALPLYDAFTTRFPDLAHTYTIVTGSGGRHVYLRSDQLPPSQCLKGMELRGNGLQVVAPPSVHPTTGRHYQIERYLPIRQVPNLDLVTTWLSTLCLSKAPHSPPKATRSKPAIAINPELVTAIAKHLQALGYRQKAEWLNGQCLYPEHHAHRDLRSSFGFNTHTGYGFCFVCGSMLARDIAARIGIDPAEYGGVITHNRSTPHEPNTAYCTPA